VAFHPDGKRLVSAGGYASKKNIYGASQILIQRWDGVDDQRPGELKVWDLDRGEELYTVRVHAGGVLGVACSPDGKWIASAGTDALIKLLDAADGKEVRPLKGHRKAVNAVTFSPDGGRLASAAADGLVKTWDPAAGREVFSVSKEHGKPPGDGRTRVQVQVEKTFANGQKEVEDKVLTFIRETNDVLGVAFSPDGRRLASADDHENVKVWDAATGQDVLTLRGSRAVAWSADGRRLATVSAGSRDSVVIWEAANGFKAFTFEPGATRTGEVHSLAWSPDGRRVAAIEGVVKVWTAAARDEPAPPGPANSK
jgi:WD40 repeat protein